MKVIRPTHPAFLLAKPKGFDFPTQLIGNTRDGKVTVYYDPSLGAPGLANARDLLLAAPALYTDCVNWFGVQGQPVTVIIASLNGNTDGSDGAYHYGCDFVSGGDLYLDAAFGNSVMVQGLFIAELTECFMGAANKGWNCGGSGGEALSRFLAEKVSGGADGALAGYATAPTWISAGKPNWIDKDQGTDQDPVSTGCGMVYLSWVRSMGFSEAQITQAGGATLAANYQTLTGKGTAWADMLTAVWGMSVPNDDPFGAVQPKPQPQPGPTPPPVPPTPPTPPIPPLPGVTQADAIAAFTALVRASTLPK